MSGESATGAYLHDAYAHLELDTPSMRNFLDEIVSNLRRHADLSSATSLVDFGCGKGYLLARLRAEGLQGLTGIEPEGWVAGTALFPGIGRGGFEANELQAASHDISFTCHTFHHLQDPFPVFAVKEMARVSRRYVVVVEINNTNLPMVLRSWAFREHEVNAVRYNLGRLRRLFAAAGVEMVYSANMRAGYLSGSSLLHRLAARCGMPPYNLTIGKVA